MTSHIPSKCGPSLHCWCACAFSDLHHDQMTSGIAHNCCGLPCASSGFLLDRKISHILNKSEPCLRCWQASFLAFRFGLSWYVTLFELICNTQCSDFCQTEWSVTFLWDCTHQLRLWFWTNATFTFHSLMQIYFSKFWYWSFYCEWSGAFYDKRKYPQWS